LFVNHITRRSIAVCALVFAVLFLLLAPRVANAQSLSPGDPGFWVELPDGGRVPYDHPLARGTGAPSPTTPQPPVLTTSDPGFWVTLPSGARVPYNHPDAVGLAPAATPITVTPAPPTIVPPTVTPVTGTPPARTPTPAPVTYTAAVQLRVLQWNIHHGVGLDGTYDNVRLATWMAAMNADVIMLNEVERSTSWGREDQPARFEAMLEAMTGKEWYGFFSQGYGDWTATGRGNMILSRYPIESSDRAVISFTRVVSDARIRVNGRSISLIGTHLDPDSPTWRLTQVEEVMRWGAAFPENRIVAGDMNAWPDQASILSYNTAYYDSWTVASNKQAAYGFSGLAPDGATRNGRIDYILYSRNAPDLVVVDSRVYDTRDASGWMPSDHRPVVTTFNVR
jgi:endonuclease/exonuclease/phosphatase family metal-dependent hydrolase